MPSLYQILAKTDSADSFLAEVNTQQANTRNLPPMFDYLSDDQLSFVHLAVELMQAPDNYAQLNERKARKNKLAIKDLAKRIAKKTNAKTIDGYSPSSYVDILSRSCNLVLQGQAGTGKTTTISSVLSYIAYEQPELLSQIAYICPTGAAAARSKDLLMEASDKLKLLAGLNTCKQALAVDSLNSLDTNTIHMYLAFKPCDLPNGKINQYGEPELTQIFKPDFNAARLKQGIKIVIVEEMSMLGLKLNYQLQVAHEPDTLFIYIGDINQVSTVADTPAAVRFMYVGGEQNLAILDKVHRYSGHILTQASNVLKGITPKTDNESLFTRDLAALPDTARLNLVHDITALYGAKNYDPELDQIITATNVGPLGQIAINQDLAIKVNPQALDSYALVNLGYGREEWFYLGARLIFTQNMLEYGLVNGTRCKLVEIKPNPKYIGKVKQKMYGKLELASNKIVAQNLPTSEDLDQFLLSSDPDLAFNSAKDDEIPSTRQSTHSLTIEYEDVATRRVVQKTLSSCSAISNLIYGYACTCYKAQGSEYRNVFVLIHHSMAGLNREFLYTAMTRTGKAGKLFIFKEPADATMLKTLKRQALLGNTIQAKIKNACGVNELKS